MATTNDQENNPSMGTKSLKTLGGTHFYLGLYAYIMYIDDIDSVYSKHVFLICTEVALLFHNEC